SVPAAAKVANTPPESAATTICMRTVKAGGRAKVSAARGNRCDGAHYTHRVATSLGRHPDRGRHPAGVALAAIREEPACVGMRAMAAAIDTADPGAREMRSRKREEVGVPLAGLLR